MITDFLILSGLLEQFLFHTANFFADAKHLREKYITVSYKLRRVGHTSSTV